MDPDDEAIALHRPELLARDRERPRVRGSEHAMTVGAHVGQRPERNKWHRLPLRTTHRKVFGARRGSAVRTPRGTRTHNLQMKRLLRGEQPVGTPRGTRTHNLQIKSL